MDNSTILFAFSLTLLAGLSTGIGGIVAFLKKGSDPRFLSVALGFSAGVMIYVSFMEIMVEAKEHLIEEWGSSTGEIVGVLAFFGGIFLIAAIDKLVPHDDNPHHSPNEQEYRELTEEGEKKLEKVMGDPNLKRVGIMTALAIAIHNFPEGLATFSAALADPNLGVAIAVAIAIHNIPEGIAVAIPMYLATGSRGKAFMHSLLSGLAEPLGALVGFLLLMPFLSPGVFGILFASVAGIMVFISLDKLLPTAEEYGEHHLCIYGLIGGMAIMAVSLILLG